MFVIIVPEKSLFAVGGLTLSLQNEVIELGLTIIGERFPPFYPIHIRHEWSGFSMQK